MVDLQRNDTLLIATNNKGKAQEIREILSPIYPNVVTLKEAGIDLEVEEDGTTFNENALKKAREAAAIAHMDTLADDSGLLVDALDGEPGVYSARYAGEPCDDRKNIRLLLERMRDVPEYERNAHFECSIALCKRDGSYIVVQGCVDGIILRQPVGEGGFGYDPIFYYPLLRKTFAQLSPQQKNAISHRAQALQKLLEVLQDQE